MHNPFAPFIAIAQWRIPFPASHRPLPRLPRYPQSLASRGQPQRPTPPLADTRIQLKVSGLRKRTRIIELRHHPGDASCEKSPSGASPNVAPPPQPIETEELKT